MNLVLLGTGAVRPEADRSTSNYVVKMGDKKILIDCGGGTSMRLMQAKVSPTTLNSIFFTHLHGDHCAEYPCLVHAAWLMNRKDPLTVFGPSGTQKMHEIFFNDLFTYAYPQIKKLKGIDMDIRITEINEGVIQDNDWGKISAARVIHGPIESYAYRFDSEGKSIVISGDTAPAQSLIELSQGADLLLHECSFPDERGETPAHTIPRQLGEIANKSKVKKVVLTHLFPECKGKENEMVQSIEQNFSGEIIVGKDLMELEI
jgi:ribonuclease BN (tRNA processing enzyme)|tara:strand:+ start:2622 stop:3401 length:780 start_codon:yes stop_codon:yes gene_type:complete